MMVTVELIESCLDNLVATAGSSCSVIAGSSCSVIAGSSSSIGVGMGCIFIETSHPIFITCWGIYNQTCNDPPLPPEFMLRCILSLRNISFLQSRHKQTIINTQYSEKDKSKRWSRGCETKIITEIILKMVPRPYNTCFIYDIGYQYL
jgi:hypothetical protein